MNQIGTTLLALSPQGGERVAAGRERGGSWEATTISESRIGAMNLPPHPPFGHPLPLGGGEGRGEGAGSWRASFRFSACIGTMNQIGTPLPALSPQGGERVAEGRERGGSWRGK